MLLFFATTAPAAETKPEQQENNCSNIPNKTNKKILTKNLNSKTYFTFS